MDLARLPALTATRTPAAQASRDVSAAQRAFFQAALGEAVGSAPAAAPEAAQAVSQTAEAPRIPRPGSIIDIRV